MSEKATTSIFDEAAWSRAEASAVIESGLVRSACALDACASEFEGDLTVCPEALNDFWSAMERFKAARERLYLEREIERRTEA